MEIAVKNVSKVYKGGKRALDGVNINLDAPAFIGLLGPNGAGKSTLMKLLTLGILPTSGDITIDGARLLDKEKWLKKNLGYLPQEYGLYEELTVEQYLDYMCALKDLRKNVPMEIDQAVALANLEEKRTNRIQTLSGGYKQRVAIAQALLGNPGIIIFDEPTVGLDPEERLSFRNKFSEVARDRLVILSTHIIEDIQNVCNRLIVLFRGRILYDGAPNGLLAIAEGHVGTYEYSLAAQSPEALFTACRITSKVVLPEKTMCRIVAETLPEPAQPLAPSLEDAYIYLCAQEESRQ